MTECRYFVFIFPVEVQTGHIILSTLQVSVKSWSQDGGSYCSACCWSRAACRRRCCCRCCWWSGRGCQTIGLSFPSVDFSAVASFPPPSLGTDPILGAGPKPPPSLQYLMPHSQNDSHRWGRYNLFRFLRSSRQVETITVPAAFVPGDVRDCSKGVPTFLTATFSLQFAPSLHSAKTCWVVPGSQSFPTRVELSVCVSVGIWWSG